MSDATPEASPPAKPEKAIGTVWVMAGLDCVPKAFFDLHGPFRDWNVRNIEALYNREQPEFDWRIRYPSNGWRFASQQRVEASRTFEGAWLFFMDVDMMHQPNTLGRMLMSMESITAAHGQCDVLTGLYTKREPSALPIIYRYVPELDYWPPILEYPKDRPFLVDGCGAGCLLIKRHVIETLLKRFGRTFEWQPNHNTEDLPFNDLCRQVGFKTWCDPSIQCGHLYMGANMPADFEPHQQEAIAEAQEKGLPYRPIPDPKFVSFAEALELTGRTADELREGIKGRKVTARHDPGGAMWPELTTLLAWHQRGGT